MANQETGVTVIEQSTKDSVIEWTLDEFPVDRFNRLVPMQSITIPNDLFKPAYQVILADPPAPDGKSPDTYTSSDVPGGHRAPTARFLRKVSTAAGITFSNERRLDDGTNPDVLGVTMDASMVLPTGQRVSAPGSQLIDINTWFKRGKDGAFEHPAEVAKFRKQFYANVQTRAMNRAIRGILAMRSSYPEAELRKPFLVVSYVPNLNHPEIRARVLEAIAPVTAQLYGPAAAKQLGAGASDVNLDEAPDEDPAPTPTALPGEKLAKAAAVEEPDWMQDAPAEPKPFLEAIRAAALEGDDPEALASADEKAALRSIFEPLRGRIGPGLDAIWPGQSPNTISIGQVRAITLVHDSLGAEAFAREWTAVAEKAAAAA